MYTFILHNFVPFVFSKFQHKDLLNPTPTSTGWNQSSHCISSYNTRQEQGSKGYKKQKYKAIVKMFTLFLPALFRISPLILYHVTTPHGNIFSLYCHYLKEIKQIQICQRSLDLFINISERICNRYSIHFEQC